MDCGRYRRGGRALPPWTAAAATPSCPLARLSFQRLFREFLTSEKYSGTSSAILVIFRTFQVPYWHAFGELSEWPPPTGLFAVRENRLFEPQNLSIHRN
ncbi:hypothetical protein JCGZ_03967 [Jatropha curcas]|uniref:Uncharacterized protein n=1 Tax=Jatropha curcas TaxID=180498 RepID=A0A067JCW2_JATCU|nr:hypothetical protein JCGZ_03967 [Jatropha curcas]